MDIIKRILVLVLSFVLLNSAYAQKFTVETKGEVEKIIANTISTNETSAFLNFITEKERDEHFVSLGKISGFKRYSAVFRNKSPWMIPSVGDRIEEIPIETQFLLIDRGNSEYLMMIPLVDNSTRCSLNGTKYGEMQLIAETGDSLTKTDNFLGLYVLSGKNPQQMVKRALMEIQKELKTFKLRKEKSDPWFADYFGWCTWNAIGPNLSHDKLIDAAEVFKNKNIPIRYFLIDDGWQSSNGHLLGGYSADKEKFPNGIGETVRILKSEYGMEKVMIWTALWGKFRGLDPKVFPEIAKEVSFLPPPRMDYLLKNKYEPIGYEATVGPSFYPQFVGGQHKHSSFYSFLRRVL